MKKIIWVPIVAAVILLIAVLGAIFATPVGAVVANALSGNGPAGNPMWGGPWHGGWGGGNHGFTLPPALQGLASIPADQRFAHFNGAQINLKDQNNQPLTLNVIPGKVTAASATSLSITANDSSSQTFTIDSQTLVHGKQASAPAATGTPSSTPAPAAALSTGDAVIVVTTNNSKTAMAVIDGGPSGFSWSGPGGW